MPHPLPCPVCSARSRWRPTQIPALLIEEAAGGQMVRCPADCGFVPKLLEEQQAIASLDRPAKDPATQEAFLNQKDKEATRRRVRAATSMGLAL